MHIITHLASRSLIILPAARSFSSLGRRRPPPPTPPLYLGKGRSRRPVVAALSRSSSPMAADAESFSTVVSSSEEEAKFGFTRAEMFKESLLGTMGDEYDRHVFLCYKDPSAWVSKIETSADDPMVKRLAGAVRSRGKEITPKTRVTVSEGHAGTDFEDGDLLIFPDMIKYKGFNESNAESFVEEVLIKGQQWSAGAPEVLPGSHIFVCAHGSRDKRCGVCGPVLIEKLKEGIEARGLTNQVFVNACSHIGGHKYAGNLIIFNPNAEGKMIGHWYGYVTPEDVPEILDQHIGNGIVLEKLLRGQMGVHPEGGEKGPEKAVSNGIETNKSHSHVESKTDVKENTSSCCQGANGFSCCQDVSSQVSQEKKVKEIIDAKKKGVGKVSNWIASLEQSDVLAAVAVFGAVAAVAVAYRVYRRSG